MSSVRMPPRVMVTGAGGFVGHHLVRHLVRRLPAGSRVFACCQAQHGQVTDRTESCILDVSDSAQVDAAIRRISPTHIVHLASISTLAAAEADPDRAWRVIFSGTLHLAKAMSMHSPGGQFVFISSSEIYGRSFQSGQAVNEQVPLAPLNLYARIKADADLALEQLDAGKISVVRVRPFNHTGPGQTEHFALPAFAAQIARIECGLQPPVIRVGNLESKRDFLDVRDVVDAYARIVERADQLPDNIVLNIASGIPRRIRTVLDDMLALARVPIDIVPDETRLRPSETPLILGDATRARTLLDWSPSRAWTETLVDTLEYWRQRVASPESIISAHP